jgi:hypothetical protein
VRDKAAADRVEHELSCGFTSFIWLAVDFNAISGARLCEVKKRFMSVFSDLLSGVSAGRLTKFRLRNVATNSGLKSKRMFDHVGTPSHKNDDGPQSSRSTMRTQERVVVAPQRLTAAKQRTNWMTSWP